MDEVTSDPTERPRVLKRKASPPADSDDDDGSSGRLHKQIKLHIRKRSWIWYDLAVYMWYQSSNACQEIAKRQRAEVPGVAEEVRRSQPQTASSGDNMELGQTSLPQQDPVREDQTSAEPQDVEMTDDLGTDSLMRPLGEQSIDELIAKMDLTHRQEVRDLERRYTTEAHAVAAALRLKEEEAVQAKHRVCELESVLSQKQNLAGAAERVVELERQLTAPHVGQRQIAGPMERHEERMDQSGDNTVWLRERVSALKDLEESAAVAADLLEKDAYSMIDDRVPELQAELKHLTGRADELEVYGMYQNKVQTLENDKKKLEESAKETISLGERLSKAQRKLDTLYGENEVLEEWCIRRLHKNSMYLQVLSSKLLDSERRVRALNHEIEDLQEKQSQAKDTISALEAEKTARKVPLEALNGASEIRTQLTRAQRKIDGLDQVKKARVSVLRKEKASKFSALENDNA
ncbi:hypothetical protein HDZ31DRAFT_77685, partial [Schizophyllum fasciatum]